MSQPENLQPLNQLVGDWTSRMTHPAMPGAVIPARATVEWLEGERFLLMRSQADHPDFPDSLWVLGETDADGLCATYFDSRGVHRIYRLGFEDGVWRMWRDDPAFAQRFIATFENGGDRIAGAWELAEDGATFAPDLEITFERARG